MMLAAPVAALSAHETAARGMAKRAFHTCQNLITKQAPGLNHPAQDLTAADRNLRIHGILSKHKATQ